MFRRITYKSEVRACNALPDSSDYSYPPNLRRGKRNTATLVVALFHRLNVRLPAIWFHGKGISMRQAYSHEKTTLRPVRQHDRSAMFLDYCLRDA